MYFWDKIFGSNLINIFPLLLVGDLNFTRHRYEVCVERDRLYPLQYYFLNKLQVNDLIDVQLVECKPTWFNRTTRVETITKRMTKFLLFGEILRKMERCRSWREIGGGSNHLPILLQMDKGERKPTNSFKFNHHWLQDHNFVNLIKSN